MPGAAGRGPVRYFWPGKSYGRYQKYPSTTHRKGQFYTVHEFAQATCIWYLCLANRTPIPHLCSLVHGDHLHVAPHQKCVLPHCWQTCVNGGRIARSISQLPFTTHSLKVSSPVLKLDLFSAFTPVSTRLTKIEVAIDQMNAVSGMPHLYLNLSSLTIIASMKQQMWVCGRPITHQRPILTHESLMPFATWSRWFSLASQIAHILFNVTALLLECMQKSYAWESDRSEVVIWSRSIELKSRRL